MAHIHDRAVTILTLRIASQSKDVTINVFTFPYRVIADVRLEAANVLVNDFTMQACTCIRTDTMQALNQYVHVMYASSATYRRVDLIHALTQFVYATYASVVTCSRVKLPKLGALREL